jgi:error-prone DNA polymerase
VSGANGSARRLALWQLGVATPGHGVPGGTQLALPLELPAPPRLRDLSAWDAMLADYGTTGLTTKDHPLALLRGQLPADAVTSRDLDRLRHGTRVQIAGMVVARQRPGTANGVVFVLLEDEFGTINLIVPPAIYERHRLTVRTEPLMIVAGKLERFAAAGGAINVLVDTVGAISVPDRPVAEVKDFSMLDERERRRIAADREREVAAAKGGSEEQADERTAAVAGEDFRAVAPAVMSFGSGRRR